MSSFRERMLEEEHFRILASMPGRDPELKAETISIATGKTPIEAICKMPKLGHQLHGLKCMSHSAEMIPRGFFDWLFGRPHKWIVTTVYKPDGTQCTKPSMPQPNTENICQPHRPNPDRFPADVMTVAPMTRPAETEST